MSSDMSRGHDRAVEAALDGLVVVDFSRVLAGPFAAMMLGDLGASVVKVERPDGGDDTRHWGPPHRGDEATYFLAANRNKRSIALDLRDQQDHEIARALCRRADVIVENFRPGTMDRLGLGYDALAAEQPDLVYCAVSGFGRGAGASLPGYDLLVQAVGGLMSISGAPDGEPTKAGVALVDVLAGLFATVGILAALRDRERTGRGQRVDVDLLSSLLAALVNQSTAYVAGGAVPGRLGNAHPSIAPYELLRAADGDLVVAVGNDRQFAALCEVLRMPELAQDPAYATNADRVANREALRRRLEDVLAADTVAAWSDALAAVGVPSGPVNGIDEAFALAQRLGLDPIVATRRPDGTELPQVASPIGLSRTAPTYRCAPPRLDQDREAVLRLLDAPSPTRSPA